MQFISKSGRQFDAIFCHTNRFTLLQGVDTKFELNTNKKALTADYNLQPFLKALGIKNKVNHITIEIHEDTYNALLAIVTAEKEAKERAEAERISLLPKTIVVTFDGFNSDGYFFDQQLQIIELRKEGEKWYNNKVLFSSKHYNLTQKMVSEMPNPIILGYNPNIPAAEVVTQEQIDAIIAESNDIANAKQKAIDEKAEQKKADRQAIFDKAKETGIPQILDSIMSIEPHKDSETYHFSTTYAMPDGSTSTNGSSVEMS